MVTAISSTWPITVFSQGWLEKTSSPSIVFASVRVKQQCIQLLLQNFPNIVPFSYSHRAWTTCRWILTTSLQTSHVDSNTICNYVIYISTEKPRKVNVPKLLTEFFLHHTILFLCEKKNAVTDGNKRTEPNRPGSIHQPHRQIIGSEKSYGTKPQKIPSLSGHRSVLSHNSK